MSTPPPPERRDRLAGDPAQRASRAGALPPQDEVARLFEDESQTFENDARADQQSMLSLLAYIDGEMPKDVSLPVVADPLKLVAYVASIIETRRTVEDIKHRRELIENVTKFTVGWICVVLAILLLSSVRWTGFRVDDKVLMVLLGTTTVNVLGLAVIVLRGMFGHPPPDHLGTHHEEKTGDGK